PESSVSSEFPLSFPLPPPLQKPANSSGLKRRPGTLLYLGMRILCLPPASWSWIPPWPVIPLAPPGSLIPLAPPWSVIIPLPLWDSPSPALAHPSFCLALFSNGSTMNFQDLLQLASAFSKNLIIFSMFRPLFSWVLLSSRTASLSHQSPSSSALSLLVPASPWLILSQRHPSAFPASGLPPIIPLAPPGSLFPLAPPWSVINPLPLWDSTPLASPHPSIPLAPLWSSVALARPCPGLHLSPPTHWLCLDSLLQRGLHLVPTGSTVLPCPSGSTWVSRQPSIATGFHSSGFISFPQPFGSTLVLSRSGFATVFRVLIFGTVIGAVNFTLAHLLSIYAPGSSSNGFV
ncbi:hypothetical protein M9458_037412, partial [Cirrhinus mrigala]